MCPLKTVDLHSGCYCGIEIDGSNYIHCQPYSMNRIPEFTRSYVHNKLNLSNNFIENLTNRSFHQLKVQRIYIENNPIKYIDKQTFNNNILHYLEELYLDTLDNGSLEFLCYGTWTKLRVLKLSGFNINQYQYCFSKLARLEKLIIEHSSINAISYHIYKLPFLYELSLANNNIEYLNFDNQYLTYSSSIRILNLTSNQLQTIPNDINIRMPNLATIDLSNNLIESLPIISQTTKLNINLSSNFINTIQSKDNQHQIDLSFNPICTLEPTIDVSNLILNNLMNLHCDCRLGFFLRQNLTNLYDSIGINQPFGHETKCATPKLFSGQFLKDLSYEQLLTTCSLELPGNCREVADFNEIQQYVSHLMNRTETIIVKIQQSIDNSTQVVETTEKLHHDEAPSFHLTSFNTHYEHNDLLIYWDFDANLLLNNFSKIKFQIIIEKEYQSKIDIIRHTDFISPLLRQYAIPNLPSNQIYHVCLLITRLSSGTDKYCRETRTPTNQLLLVNRTIILGFLIGTILTVCFLIILTFICYLHYKQKHSTKHFFNHYQQKQYMCIDRNNHDGTYTCSIVSAPSLKYHYSNKHRYQTYLKTGSSCCHFHDSKEIPSSSCCLLQYHDQTLSSSLATNRITSLSSDYTDAIDKEPMTTTSIMSSASLDDQQSHIIQSSTKHIYEELGDNNNLFL